MNFLSVTTANPENGEQWPVGDIVKSAHSAETNVYDIYLKILSGICNTSWRMGGFIFLTLTDDCARYLSSIAMNLLRGEIGSI